MNFSSIPPCIVQLKISFRVNCQFNFILRISDNHFKGGDNFLLQHPIGKMSEVVNVVLY